MKYLLLSTLLCIFAFNMKAQQVKDYEIDLEFFPDNAKMWGHRVSPDAFMRGNSLVHFSECNTDTIRFYCGRFASTLYHMLNLVAIKIASRLFSWESRGFPRRVWWTNAAKRFKKTKIGVYLMHQLMDRLSKQWRRLNSAHLCPTVTLPNASKKSNTQAA